MDDALAVYRVHRGGLWTSKRHIEQKFELLKMMSGLDRYTDFKYSDAIRRWRAGCYFDMAIIERLNGRRGVTLKYLMSALRLGIFQTILRWRELLAILTYGILGFRPNTENKDRKSTRL